MANAIKSLENKIKAEINIDDGFDNTICFLIHQIIKQRYHLNIEQADSVDEYMYQSGAYELLSRTIKECDKYGEKIKEIKAIRK